MKLVSNGMRVRVDCIVAFHCRLRGWGERRASNSFGFDGCVEWCITGVQDAEAFLIYIKSLN